VNSARVTRYQELVAKYDQTTSKSHRTRLMKKLNALYRHMTREERDAVDGRSQQ